MFHRIRTVILAIIAVISLPGMAVVPTARAQSPSDVPWEQVPDDLKQAIKAQAEEQGKAFSLTYAENCPTEDHRGQLCARVLTLDASTARVCIGLFRSECSFFDFTKTAAGWTGVRVTPAPPAVGNGQGIGSESDPVELTTFAGVVLLATAGGLALWHLGRNRFERK